MLVVTLFIAATGCLVLYCYARLNVLPRLQLTPLARPLATARHPATPPGLLAATVKPERGQGARRPTSDVQQGRRLPLRILLVEDNITNEQLALRMLQRLGYSATVARNGREAIAACQSEIFDLVLMDIQMPELDGMQATAILRRLLPPEHQPYIIAVTANSFIGDRESCLAVGMNDYLSKPIELRRLGDALARAAGALGARLSPLAPSAALEPPPPDEGAMPQAQAASGTLDHTALRRLHAALGKRAPLVLPELVATFLTEATQLLADADHALAANDLVTLHRVAHTLKANSLTFGARDLERVCLVLERRAGAGRSEGTKELLAAVGEEFIRVREALAPLALPAAPVP